MSVVRVGLLGLGTVGCGVVKTIRSQEKKLTERLGKKVEIVKALVRDVSKSRSVEVDGGLLTTRFDDVLQSDPDILVEVMGGVEPTFDYLRQGIEKGCHVVTANKELLAKRGQELIRLANRHRVHLAYEASVAGGIPILGVLRQFLRTNQIVSVQGIVNGTTNYIVTQMEQHQRNYADVLKEAQQLGYAELDPTSDVEGFDPLYKLYILAQLVFGEAVPLHVAEREGISSLSISQILFAKELGYRIKLLAKAEKRENVLRLSVRPTLIPLDHPLAAIQNADNGVQVTGNIVGELMFAGKGAGELPTASAVVEDLAYLLTQPFAPQQNWREADQVTASDVSGDVQGSCFLYMETNQGDCSPAKLFELFAEQQVAIRKQITQYSRGEAMRIGLIADQIPPQLLEVLRSGFQLDVKLFPILQKTERNVADTNPNLEQKQLVFSQNI